MQAATGTDRFDAGPQPKMISVSQNDARIEIIVFELFKSNPLYAAAVPRA